MKRLYCPRNGCGMQNGAAPPCPVKCKHCSYVEKLTNFDKFCPQCKHCLSCGRIIKKFGRFNGIVDFIRDGIAYVTMENDVLLEISAVEFDLKEHRRFVLEIDEENFKVHPVADIEISEEELAIIDKEIDELIDELGDDLNGDY